LTRQPIPGRIIDAGAKMENSAPKTFAFEDNTLTFMTPRKPLDDEEERKWLVWADRLAEGLGYSGGLAYPPLRLKANIDVARMNPKLDAAIQEAIAACPAPWHINGWH
jgi:hypothetical protein